MAGTDVARRHSALRQRRKAGSHPVRRCLIGEMLGAPFRSRTAHIVLFRPVFPVRPAMKWKQKAQQRGDGAARKRSETSGQARECCHRRLDYLFLSSLRKELAIHASSGPSSRMPPRSNSCRIRRSFAPAIDWIRPFKQPFAQLSADRPRPCFPRPPPNR